jgi:peptide/nickel transport system ATP-binding protein
LVQLIFQKPYHALNPAKTMGQILEEPWIIQGGFSKAQRQSAVISILDEVGMDGTFQKRKVSELSGGQRQRIAIGCALIRDCKLLIADEILSALDIVTQGQILELLKARIAERKTACLFISHDIPAARAFCHRLAVMRDGNIAEIADIRD